MKNFNVHIGGADHSEKSYRDVAHLDLAPVIPVSFDADFSKIPVQMQNQIGICTAEAVCSLIERFRNDGIVLSRRFTYLVGKTLVDGNLTEGSSIKSMLQGAYKYGTQPELVVPTDTTMTYGNFCNFDVTPFLSTATKIPGYISVPVDPISYASGMIKYGGLAIRYDCGATWWSDSNGNTWDASRILPLQTPSTVISGHAICATGYDYTYKHRGNIRNSWSTAWALNGDGYAYLEDYSPTEAWAITPNTPVLVPKWTHTFTQNLSYGQTSGEVANLQKALQLDGCFPNNITPTGYYGEITRQAVSAFQYKYKVANSIILYFNGGKFVGQMTNTVLNKLFAQ